MGHWSEQRIIHLKNRISETKDNIVDIEWKIDELEDDEDDFDNMELDLAEWELSELNWLLEDLETELELFQDAEYIEAYDNKHRNIERFKWDKFDMPRTLKGFEYWKFPLYPQAG